MSLQIICYGDVSHLLTLHFFVKLKLFSKIFLNTVIFAPLLLSPPALADADRVLKIATVDNYLPCSNKNSGVFEGVSIDVWRAVAEENNIHYEMSALPTFSEATLAATAGKYDVIASCHDLTEDRLAVVDFSVPYRTDKFGLLSKNKFDFEKLFIFRLFEDKLLIYSISTLAILSLVGSLVVYKLEHNKLGILNLDKDKRSQLFKTWTMFMVGEYGDRSSMEKGMVVIILFFFIRLTVVTAVVGSSVSEIFKSTPAENMAEMDASEIEAIVDSGIAVQSGTAQEKWLDDKLDKMNIDKSKLIRHGGEEILFVNDIESGKVSHILSEVSLLRQFQSMTKDPSKYYVSVKDPVVRKQAFLFGSNLDQPLRRQINISLIKLVHDGEVVRLEDSWKP